MPANMVGLTHRANRFQCLYRGCVTTPRQADTLGQRLALMQGHTYYRQIGYSTTDKRQVTDMWGFRPGAAKVSRR